MSHHTDEHRTDRSTTTFLLGPALEAVSDAIWVVDSELRICYINRRGQWFHSLVIGREVAVGDESVYVAPSTEELWLDRYRRALSGERICFLEQHNDGKEQHHFDVCIESTNRDQRTNRHVVVIARPVSQRRRTLLDASIGGTVILDDKSRILFANNGFEVLVGETRDELESGHFLLEFVHSDDKPELFAIIADSHERGREGRYERQLRLVDTEGRLHHVVAVCGTSPDTHHTVVSMLDITDQMEAQNRLRQQADHLRALHGSAAELNTLIREPLLLYRRALELLREAVVYDTASVQLLEEGMLRVVACAGFPKADEVVGIEFPHDARFPNWHVVEEQRTLTLDDVRETHPHFKDESGALSSGNIHSWLGVPLTARGEVVGMIALDRNTVSPFTTDEQRLVSATANHVAVAVHNASLYLTQRRYEEELRAAGNQKELLLRELHHRVKNNMQLVSSLLSLRLSALPNPEISDVLEEMKIRIESLGAIHEELYQSERVDSVDLGGYTHRIVDLVVSSYGPQPGVRVEVETDEVAATVETSVPYGLILSELVLNSLKHGFPDNRTGVISVVLSSEANDSVLKVADDGIGMPAAMRDGRTGSLGMQLIQSLGEQIGGEVDVDTSAGTLWSLRFPAFSPQVRDEH